MSAIVDKIISRGHWDVSIAPEHFEPERVPYGELEEALRRSVVSLRGWPVPFIDHRVDVIRRENWIGQDIDASTVEMYEAWRFFQSGRFNHLRSVSADWRRGTEATPTPASAESVIEVWEILYYLTEVMELASKLSLTQAGNDRMAITAILSKLQKRALVLGFSDRPPWPWEYVSDVKSLTVRRIVGREQLISDGHRLAADMAREVFLRFGWKPAVDQLVGLQAGLLNSQ
ncbi:MAG: hypothetical protein M0Z30_10695 [Actinomycetota bacterium]|nr:hypothetical protein [Actinomycetota bacterium]